MKEYRYSLEQYQGKNTRHTCPNPDCNRPNVFVRYVDKATGEYIAENVGRCNREIKCGYHYTPSDYFADNKNSVNSSKPSLHLLTKPVTIETEKPIAFIPFEKYSEHLKNYDGNNFVLYLYKIFSSDTVAALVKKYFIGTSNHWMHSTVFPQIDIDGNIRQIKIMDYNPETGRRKKSADESWRWSDSTQSYFRDIHGSDKVFFAGKKILGDTSANLQQCFYGEHLLRESNKAVAIVESEKTAIIASVYLPNFIWLATGGLHGCRWADGKVNRVLKGRDIVLFPDLNAYHIWEEKAKSILRVASKVVISELMERNATADERIEGLDIADHLLRFSLAEFIKHNGSKSI